MIQGTTENAAFRIVKNGFATTASLDDGYYGRGIYFTSLMRYAATYSKGTPQGKVFLVCLSVPGNSFPVTEVPFLRDGKSPNPKGYLGQACRGGYQSHYVVVSSKGEPVQEKVSTSEKAGQGSEKLMKNQQKLLENRERQLLGQQKQLEELSKLLMRAEKE